MTRSLQIAVLSFAGLSAACDGPTISAPGTEKPATAESGEAAAPAARTAAPGHGDIAFATYRGGREKIVFINDRLVKKTWRNMAGKAVKGTYTKAGQEIKIAWDPTASNHGSVEARYRQLGPCSIAFYQRTDKEGVVHDDFSVVLEQSKPRCRAVKVAR
jgi:hypothetical protein